MFTAPSANITETSNVSTQSTTLNQTNATPSTTSSPQVVTETTTASIPKGKEKSVEKLFSKMIPSILSISKSWTVWK